MKKKKLAELDLRSFPPDLYDWVEPLEGSEYAFSIFLTLGAMCFVKLVDGDINVKQAKAWRHPKEMSCFSRCQEYIPNKLGEMNKMLFRSFQERSSFQAEFIDLIALEDLADADGEEVLGWDGSERKRQVLRHQDLLLIKSQQKLFKTISEPMLESIDFPYGRRAVYLHSEKLAGYLEFTKKNAGAIGSQFAQDEIRTAASELQHPCIGAHIHDQGEYLVGFCMGAEIEGGISYQDIGWNFLVSLYVLEKLLAEANGFFHLCARHGTNLAGASPATGIYRQV